MTHITFPCTLYTHSSSDIILFYQPEHLDTSPACKQHFISHRDATTTVLNKQKHKMCCVACCALGSGAPQCTCVFAHQATQCSRAHIPSVATCRKCCSATARTDDFLCKCIKSLRLLLVTVKDRQALDHRFHFNSQCCPAFSFPSRTPCARIPPTSGILIRLFELSPHDLC